MKKIITLLAISILLIGCNDKEVQTKKEKKVEIKEKKIASSNNPKKEYSWSIPYSTPFHTKELIDIDGDTQEDTVQISSEGTGTATFSVIDKEGIAKYMFDIEEANSVELRDLNKDGKYEVLGLAFQDELGASMDMYAIQDEDYEYISSIYSDEQFQFLDSKIIVLLDGKEDYYTFDGLNVLDSSNQIFADYGMTFHEDIEEGAAEEEVVITESVEASSQNEEAEKEKVEEEEDNRQHAITKDAATLAYEEMMVPSLKAAFDAHAELQKFKESNFDNLPDYLYLGDKIIEIASISLDLDIQLKTNKVPVIYAEAHEELIYGLNDYRGSYENVLAMVQSPRYIPQFIEQFNDEFDGAVYQFNNSVALYSEYGYEYKQ